MPNSNMIAFVKSIPNQLIMVIIGFVLVVNSNHTDILLKGSLEAEQLLANNMELIGRILIVLGAINILIRWYLAHVADIADSEEVKV
ncbi:MAG: hypothetical protein CMB50_02400 [Euryarchaeota archaeon]|nr:hypothetical protein [Euryarchaeota archaeon]|tara:strand:- start:196 stop:456 length:261 start_codon:yes stop_codon:yes gene_type:complete